MIIKKKVDEAANEWTQSPEGVKYRKKALEELLGGLSSDAAAAGRRQLDADIVFEADIKEAYLSRFETTGIPFDTIPEGVLVDIELGLVSTIVKKEQAHYTANYGYRDYRIAEKEYQTVDPELGRRLSLVSLGGGLFRVKGDSLLSSKNVYAQNDSIIGKAVRVGRRTYDEEGAKLEPFITKGEILIVDEDTKNPLTSIDCLLPVANICMGGMSATENYKSPF